MNDDTANADTSEPRPKVCVACDQSSEEIPLICLEYRGAPLWICPRHMPLLIHQPERLVGFLPGAESP